MNKISIIPIIILMITMFSQNAEACSGDRKDKANAKCSELRGLVDAQGYPIYSDCKVGMTCSFGPKWSVYTNYNTCQVCVLTSEENAADKQSANAKCNAYMNSGDFEHCEVKSGALACTVNWDKIDQVGKYKICVKRTAGCSTNNAAEAKAICNDALAKTDDDGYNVYSDCKVCSLCTLSEKWITLKRTGVNCTAAVLKSEQKAADKNAAENKCQKLLDSGVYSKCQVKKGALACTTEYEKVAEFGKFKVCVKRKEEDDVTKKQAEAKCKELVDSNTYTKCEVRKSALACLGKLKAIDGLKFGDYKLCGERKEVNKNERELAEAKCKQYVETKVVEECKVDKNSCGFGFNKIEKIGTWNLCGKKSGFRPNPKKGCVKRELLKKKADYKNLYPNPPYKNGDKIKHCRISCEVAIICNQSWGTQQAGNIKEEDDLTDGDASTHFEGMDLVANNFGLEVSKSGNIGDCSIKCENKFNK